MPTLANKITDNPATSPLGQNRKSSIRAHVFCFAPESGHCGTESACPFRATSGSRGSLLILALEQRQRLMLGSVQIAGAGARFSPHDQIERRQAQSRCADVDKRQAAPPVADCSYINR